MQPGQFALDPRLAADAHVVGDLPLSRILLMDDTRFPWLLLVPRRSALRELTELTTADQRQLLAEIDACARVMQAQFAPHKLNIAAIGNVVAQLHVHVVARFVEDAAWPNPVWGRGARMPYLPGARDERLRELRKALQLPSA